VPSSGAVLTTANSVEGQNIGFALRGPAASHQTLALTGYAPTATLVRFEVQRFVSVRPDGDTTGSPFFGYKSETREIRDASFRLAFAFSEAAGIILAEHLSFVPHNQSLRIGHVETQPVLQGFPDQSLPDEYGTRVINGSRLAISAPRLEGQISGNALLYWFNATADLEHTAGSETLRSKVVVEPIAAGTSRVTTIWYELRANDTRAAVWASAAESNLVLFAETIDAPHVTTVSVDRPLKVEGPLPNPNTSSVWLAGNFTSAIKPNDADPSTFKVLVHGSLHQFSFGGGEIQKPSWPAIAISISLVLLVICAAGARVISATILSLYTKLKKDKLLTIPARDTIYRVIQQSPGIHFVELQKQVGSLNGTGNPIGFGALSYHLSQMERFELIVSKREGRFRRYFDVGAKMGADTARIALLQTHPVSLIAKTVLESPGLSQGDLHARIAPAHAMTRQALSYHLRRLAAKELVTIELTGRFCHYRPTERLARLSSYLSAPSLPSTEPLTPRPIVLAS
jgi:predicted transcriptional regulator